MMHFFEESRRLSSAMAWSSFSDLTSIRSISVSGYGARYRHWCSVYGCSCRRCFLELLHCGLLCLSTTTERCYFVAESNTDCLTRLPLKHLASTTLAYLTMNYYLMLSKVVGQIDSTQLLAMLTKISDLTTSFFAGCFASFCFLSSLLVLEHKPWRLSKPAESQFHKRLQKLLVLK